MSTRRTFLRQSLFSAIACAWKGVPAVGEDTLSALLLEKQQNRVSAIRAAAAGAIDAIRHIKDGIELDTAIISGQKGTTIYRTDIKRVFNRFNERDPVSDHLNFNISWLRGLAPKPEELRLACSGIQGITEEQQKKIYSGAMELLRAEDSVITSNIAQLHEEERLVRRSCRSFYRDNHAELVNAGESCTPKKFRESARMRESDYKPLKQTQNHHEKFGDCPAGSWGQRVIASHNVPYSPSMDIC